jgi:hypothetical protein
MFLFVANLFRNLDELELFGQTDTPGFAPYSQFIAPSTLTLNSISSTHSTLPVTATLAANLDLQWLKSNMDKVLGALAHVSNVSELAASNLSKRTFRVLFPSWSPAVIALLVDCGATMISHNPIFRDWRELWNISRMAEIAFQAMSLMIEVVPWSLDKSMFRNFHFVDVTYSIRRCPQTQVQQYRGFKIKFSNLATMLRRWLRIVPKSSVFSRAPTRLPSISTKPDTLCGGADLHTCTIGPRG